MSKLYAFENLKKFLEAEGHIVDKKSSYQVVRAKIGREEFENNKIDFTEKGIYFIDQYNVRHQGYMHQFDYLVDRYGLPKFHVLPCKTLQDFKNRGQYNAYYRFSNSETETISERSDSSGKTIYENVSLNLCGYCKKLLREMQLEEYATTKEFANYLGTTGYDKSEVLEVDMYGYVKDWWRISKLIKFNRNYTCEACGVNLSSPFLERFCEVHHIDGNKQNNNESNLKCLCIACHADEKYHQVNYSKGANKVRLDNYFSLINKNNI